MIVVLGPLLFLVNINDFSESDKIVKIVFFAVDTAVFSDRNRRNKDFKSDVSAVKTWLLQNDLP